MPGGIRPIGSGQGTLISRPAPKLRHGIMTGAVDTQSAAGWLPWEVNASRFGMLARDPPPNLSGDPERPGNPLAYWSNG